MNNGDTERKPISPAQLVRIRKGLELLVFGLAGFWFYQYGPVWRLPRIVREISCICIAFGGFVIYRASIPV